MKLIKTPALFVALLLVTSGIAQADVVCEGSNGLIVADVSDCVDNSTNDNSTNDNSTNDNSTNDNSTNDNSTDSSITIGDVGDVGGNIGGTYIDKSVSVQQSN